LEGDAFVRREERRFGGAVETVKSAELDTLAPGTGSTGTTLEEREGIISGVAGGLHGE